MENNEVHRTQNNSEQEIAIDWKDLMYKVLRNWCWFLLSVVVCLAVGIIVEKSSLKYYTRSATIMVKGKKGTSNLVSVSDLMGGSSSNIDNEIYLFKSRTLMRGVVDRLGLEVSYSYKPVLREYDLYGESPVHVLFPDENPYSSMSLTVVPQNDREVLVKGFDDKSEHLVRLRDTANTPIGRVVVLPTWSYHKYVGKEIFVRKNNIKKVANSYCSAMSIVKPGGNKSGNLSVIQLSMEDRSAAKAEDIINTLVQMYREESVKDKVRIMDQSLEFINERIGDLDSDLGAIESGLASFKRSNRLIDLNTYGSEYLRNSDEYLQERKSLENQMAMIRYVRDYVNNMGEKYDLIPMDVGIADAQLKTVISEYNAAYLQKEKYEASGNTSQNPVVRQINTSLLTLRKSVLQALDGLQYNLKQQMERNSHLGSQASSKVQNVPEQQNYLTSIEREQTVKSELYLFLLNRREEISLSKAAIEDDIRIVDAADGPDASTRPRASMIYMVSLLLGLLIPLCVLLLLTMLDTYIHTRADIRAVCSLPILGDIPKQTSQQEKEDICIVKDGSRDAVSESFRILRSNIDMLCADREGCQVLMSTSFLPNSGKTFTFANLAASFSIAGKKILLVDLDIRKGSLNRKFKAGPVTGLTHYLSGRLSLEELLAKRHAVDRNLDILFSGPVPPNPAELLLSPKLDALIEEARKEYDYVMLDCVPVGIVADTDIVKRLADRTIFILRANYTDKRSLPELETLYREGHFPNMSVVLMDVDYSNRSYGYGYGYGAGYGYGYGYGFGNAKGYDGGEEVREKSIFHKAIHKLKYIMKPSSSSQKNKMK